MKNAEIIGALVGLAGAITNHGKTGNTDRLVLEALLSEDSPEILERIRAEKQAISPDCASCAFPCGNTSDYDMKRFYNASAEEIKAKEECLDALEEYLKRIKKDVNELPDLVYRAVTYIGCELVAESYQDLTEEIKNSKT